jgi:hypothetical protein
MTVWGTIIIDAYRHDERREVYDALEELFGPTSGTSWSTAGIYVYWDFTTREILYVGLATDLPVRFGQHNRFKGCPKRSCKRDEIDAYFAAGNKFLGFTIVPLSSLTQPSAARWDHVIDLQDRELIDIQAAFNAEALDEIRTLEGALIAAHKARTGHIPPWNKDPGRVPTQKVSPTDGTSAAVTGRFDCLLQSRRTIRELAADGEASIFEEHLHGARLLAVRSAILSEYGFRNDLLRRILAQTFAFFPGDALLESDYLNHRNPLTVGPILDPPPEDLYNARS